MKLSERIRRFAKAILTQEQCDLWADEVAQLEEENVLLQNIREAQAAMINKLFAEKQEPVDSLLADTQESE